MSEVVEWQTDGTPGTVVAKIGRDQESCAALQQELVALQYLRSETRFPVPLAYGLVRRDGGREAVLVLAKVTGRNMAEATLSETGTARLQHEMARHVAELHDHRRSTFGAVTEAGVQRWADYFRPRFEFNYHEATERLSPHACRTTERLLSNLPEWLPEPPAATLVQGDLWATNIMVDDSDPDRPAVSAFLDPLALYADVEYELAYLRAFRTANRSFFDAYARAHPLRDGFERRCRVYWLNTLLLHVRLFGTEYVPRTEAVAREIESLA